MSLNSASWIPIFLVLFVIIHQRKRREEAVAQMLARKKKGEKTKMVELAKNFIGKECMIYTFNGTQYEGTVKEVSDGALLIERGADRAVEAINLDFVMRIREYPKKKNGKKKSVVLD